MVIHYAIKFPTGKLPSIQIVVEEMEKISGLPIVWTSEKVCLSSPSIKIPVLLYLGDDNDYMITAFVRNADYLMVTTIYALINLGGSFEGILPSWAGKKWKDINKLYFFIKRHRIS